MKRIIASIAITTALFTAVSCGITGKAYTHDGNDDVELGYGTIKRDLKTNSSSTVKAKDRETVTYSNMLDYLRGRVPGLNISPSGEINIRGVSSPNSNGTPLFIVDGVIVPSLDNLNPAEVQSVEVIKDGTTAIYGMQGANGVIIVNMKK